jgi:hypothetical protein
VMRLGLLYFADTSASDTAYGLRDLRPLPR